MIPLDILQQLRNLDGSSPGFHKQLSNILYGEEYRQCAPNLQGDDLVWLVDYMDKVCRHAALPCSPLESFFRFSMVSILAAPPSESVCANS